jgi:hypothetical protein
MSDMAIDLKYGRVHLEHGTIGENEPVVVFRAQDVTLPLVLEAYKRICAEQGSPEHHLKAIDDATVHVTSWQLTNHTQVPQSAGYTLRSDEGEHVPAEGQNA